MQPFWYTIIKNIWHASYSIWTAFAFADVWAKPLFLLGLEVTAALIFGDRPEFLLQVI